MREFGTARMVSQGGFFEGGELIAFVRGARGRCFDFFFSFFLEFSTRWFRCLGGGIHCHG